MVVCSYPTIDLTATGENIKKLRIAHGYSVADLQEFFGFEQPQAIYKWQWGKSLPTVDNLYALSVLLHTPIEQILVPENIENDKSSGNNFSTALSILFFAKVSVLFWPSYNNKCTKLYF